MRLNTQEQSGQKVTETENTLLLISNAFRERSWSKVGSVKISKEKPYFKWSQETRRGTSHTLHWSQSTKGRTPNVFSPWKFPLLCLSGLAHGPPWLHVLDYNFLLFLNTSIMLEKHQVGFWFKVNKFKAREKICPRFAGEVPLYALWPSTIINNSPASLPNGSQRVVNPWSLCL